MTDPALTAENPAVAAFQAGRLREATPEQHRRVAVMEATIARHRRRFHAVVVDDRLVAVLRVPLIPRSRGCARAGRPRARARRTPRATRAGPGDDGDPGDGDGDDGPGLTGGPR